MPFFRQIFRIIILSTAVVSGLPVSDLAGTARAGNGMTEAKAKSLITSAIAKFQPLAEAQGGSLKAELEWDSRSVNATAIRRRNGEWIIRVRGGFARHTELTEDGLTFLVCHELGHLFGGYPFSKRGKIYSSEGNADYFAGHACAPLQWGDEPANNTVYRATVDPDAKSRCDAVYGEEGAQNLCYRTAMAAQSVATVYFSQVSWEHPPSFQIRSTKKVRKTLSGYPDPQCRLETMLAGALCSKEFIFDSPPGEDEWRKSASEEEARRYSCFRKDGYTQGVRPRCWFKPLN